MRKWTSRFEGFVKRTGAALHQQMRTLHSFKDLVASFGVEWNDEVIQRRDKSSSHRRAKHLAAAASSWEHQLVPPTFLGDGESVTGTYDWDADPDEYEEEEQEWVEEADAHCGNDDERDEDFPHEDVDLEDSVEVRKRQKRLPQQKWKMPLLI